MERGHKMLVQAYSPNNVAPLIHNVKLPNGLRCARSLREKKPVRLLGTGFSKHIRETDREKIVEELIEENYIFREITKADLICINKYESKSKPGSFNLNFLASPSTLRQLSSVESWIRYFDDRISMSDYTSANSCVKCGSLEHTQNYWDKET